MNRPYTLSHVRPFFGALLLAVLTLTLLPASAWAQASDGADASANADARTQFGEQLDTAKALVDAGDPESLVQAGETFLQAAETAKGSGDAELAERTTNTLENALKAFMDAGTAYSGADNHEAGAAQFVRAAEVAAMLEDPTVQAQALSNATVAYLKVENTDGALSSIDEAIVLVPSDLNYHYTRGVVQRSAGDTEGAIATFAKLDTLATEAGDDAMVEKARDNAGKIHLVAAQEALKAKAYQDAVDAVDAAVPFMGEDNKTVQTFYANAYYRLGVDQVKAENWNAAERSLNKAKEYGQSSGKSKIVQGAQAQLDYIKQVKASQ